MNSVPRLNLDFPACFDLLLGEAETAHPYNPRAAASFNRCCSCFLSCSAWMRSRLTYSHAENPVLFSPFAICFSANLPFYVLTCTI